MLVSSGEIGGRIANGKSHSQEFGANIFSLAFPSAFFCGAFLPLLVWEPVLRQCWLVPRQYSPTGRVPEGRPRHLPRMVFRDQVCPTRSGRVYSRIASDAHSPLTRTRNWSMPDRSSLMRALMPFPVALITRIAGGTSRSASRTCPAHGCGNSMRFLVHVPPRTVDCHWRASTSSCACVNAHGRRRRKANIDKIIQRNEALVDFQHVARQGSRR